MKFSRPTINIEVYEIFGKDKDMMWSLFKKHHYLTDQLNKAAHCYIAKWNNKIVGFSSALPLPHGKLKNAWREHRLVILSDFQGLGIGNALSETLGEILLKDGKRFYSKTANRKLGEYRNKSPLWRPTTHNEQNQSWNSKANKEKKLKGTFKYDSKLLLRICYSHEYIGEK